MRILMFGMSSYPGGIENYIYNYFVNATMRAEHTVEFITYEPTIAYEDKLAENGYAVHRVPHLKKHPLGYFGAVKRLMKEKKYDCVYVNMLTAANVLPVVLARLFGVKRLVLHAHANATVPGFSRRLLHRLNKGFCCKAATRRLACSEQAGKWLFGQAPFEVVPNAIDCVRFRYDPAARKAVRDRLGIGEDQLVLGHVGRMAEEKNHLFMLEILNEVLKVRPDAKMIFAGDGYLSEIIRKKTEEMHLDASVCFYGTTDKAYEVYSAFDFFLFPSTFEGFGMAALEAQACGLKVFCSDTLSLELNVSGAVEYLSLQSGAGVWASALLKAEKADPSALNAAVRDSDYNIETQVKRLSEVLYE